PIIDLIFEHRMYLPLAGIAVSFPLLVMLIYRKIRETSTRRRLTSPPREAAFAAIVILTAFLVGTVMRNYVWADEVRLFTDVVEKSPLKKRPYNALAFAYYKRADYDHAVSVLEEGIERIPDSAA